MEKKIVKINESQIREMVVEATKRILKEYSDIMKFPPGFVAGKGSEWKAERIRKEAEKHPDLDPNGFQWVGDTLRHNDKKKPKSVPKPKISKPEGMSDQEYEEKLVIPNNEKYRDEISKYTE